MKNIFRVPVDYVNYKSSIESGKNFNWIKKFLTEEEIRKIEPLSISEKNLKYWGSTPGLSNLRSWGKMEAGDEVLFYREGDYIALGKVGTKINNQKLAEATWGLRKDRLTWQLIYFFVDIKEFKIDSDLVNQALGYSAGPVMGFSAIGEKTAEPIIAKFGGFSKFLEDFKIIKDKKEIKNWSLKSKLIEKPEEAEYFLLDLGKLKKQRTYSPDFGKSAFGKKLRELCDYTSVTDFLPPNVVNVVKYIDVLWFEDHFPHQAFEVIHKVGMQDAFVRFQKLKQSYRSSSLHIVGPSEKEGEFEKIRKKFDLISDEVKFNSYDQLIEMHSSLVEAQERERSFL